MLSLLNSKIVLSQQTCFGKTLQKSSLDLAKDRQSLTYFSIVLISAELSREYVICGVNRGMLDLLLSNHLRQMNSSSNFPSFCMVH